MCGIAGELNRSPPPDGDSVRAMAAVLTHRGPDAEGFWSSGPIALAHRRLSVIDTSDASNQPLLDGSRRFAIVFNGEIYNYRSIREELTRLGAGFRTKGDTEVILEAYKAWGVEALTRLNGMFALALWDSTRQSLLLARDRLGKKPLYYSRLANGGLVFASDLRAISRHPGVSAEIDPAALSEFLSLNYNQTDSCILAGVERLPPATYLEARPTSDLHRSRYWDLARHFREKRRFAREEEAAEELDSLLADAVRLRMISDVPLGGFLSGGVDSSTIVESMQRQLRSERVRTFSVGFQEASYNELGKARRVAGALGVEHRDQIVDIDMVDWFPDIVRQVGEPFADTSVVPFFFLARHARKHVTVCLSGDGADEIFAGYETYVADRLHRYLSRFPATLSRAASRLVERFVPATFDKVSFDYKLRQFLRGLVLDAGRAHHSWREIFTVEEKRELLRPEYRDLAEHDGFSADRRHLQEVADCHYLDRAMYVDIKTWLVDDILVKVDRATMAHSLEARAPFLDHRIVELAASLPIALKLRGTTKKYLLKRTARGRLPRDILDQRKQGFNAPVSHWLLDQRFADLVDAAVSRGPLSEYISPSAVSRLWREHHSRTRDNGLKLFGLACLGTWMAQRV